MSKRPKFGLGPKGVASLVLAVRACDQAIHLWLTEGEAAPRGSLRMLRLQLLRESGDQARRVLATVDRTKARAATDEIPEADIEAARAFYGAHGVTLLFSRRKWQLWRPPAKFVHSRSLQTLVYQRQDCLAEFQAREKGD